MIPAPVVLHLSCLINDSLMTWRVLGWCDVFPILGIFVMITTPSHTATHSDPRALVLCDLILSTSANPANTGRAAVLYTAQLLCLCWLDWQTLKESVTQHPTPAAHCFLRHNLLMFKYENMNICCSDQVTFSPSTLPKIHNF